MFDNIYSLCTETPLGLSKTSSIFITYNNLIVRGLLSWLNQLFNATVVLLDGVFSSQWLHEVGKFVPCFFIKVQKWLSSLISLSHSCELDQNSSKKKAMLILQQTLVSLCYQFKSNLSLPKQSSVYFKKPKIKLMQGDCKLKVATEYLLCTNDRGFLKKVIVHLTSLWIPNFSHYNLCLLSMYRQNQPC